MQPRVSHSRPTTRELRPDGPLVYEALSDPILVRRAKDGDPKALAALCERHAPAVEKLARHFLRDPEDARDAAQEALLQAYLRLAQLREPERFGPWLRQVTVNQCRMRATRGGRPPVSPGYARSSCRKGSSPVTPERRPGQAHSAAGSAFAPTVTGLSIAPNPVTLTLR